MALKTYLEYQRIFIFKVIYFIPHDQGELWAHQKQNLKPDEAQIKFKKIKKSYFFCSFLKVIK